MSEHSTTGIRGVVFDVNETLSDMAPVGGAFEAVGVPPGLSKTWFASVLRDGFALAAAGEARAFSDIAVGQLHVLLSGLELSVPLDDAVSRIMTEFTSLGVHEDVVPSLRALAATDLTVMTLSNGAADISHGMLDRAGVLDTVNALLTVEGASRWKPAPDSYEIAVRHSGLAAGQLLMVAVHPWDIHGAASAGLQTAWLNRDDSVYPGYYVQPGHVLTDLRQLVATISSPA
jgi:2-haloacid dehalogenase